MQTPTKSRFRYTLLILVLLMSAIMATIVSATTIIVDGDGSDWPVGVPTALVASDPINELSPLAPEYDIESVYLTNDATYIYVRIDTQSSPNTWRQQGLQRPTLNICLDVDYPTNNGDDTGITAPISVCNFNNVMDGVDYQITIEGSNALGDSPSISNFQDCTSGTCSLDITGASNASVAYDSGNGQHVTEVRFRAEDVGLPAGSCPGPTPCPIETGIYFDNGAGASEDSVPNTPPYLIAEVGEGSPTAVTFANTQANPLASNNTALPLLAVVLFTLTGLAMYRFRQQEL